MAENGREQTVSADGAGVLPRPEISGESSVSLVFEERTVHRDGIQSVAERIALGEHDLRERVTGKILDGFLRANLYMLAALGVVFVVDTALLAAGLQSADNRLIDAGVIKVLIGATVVEVGVLMVTIAGWLFPKRKS